ncbi:hypothetical protein CPB84DRAFT_1744231 [Gymnopilus junonius]|uniref:Uncharacterized protein n=1 Tax=Gymnopilus junonius TaxID=109634 RepID=A0A9P5NXG2_GYMJU|nr:hypothetical protein CPB84DRAFT_1744231 [Gymnopilus junonius]
MASSNRPIASSSTPPSSRVRQLWRQFEHSLTGSRLVIDHKVNAAKAKADSEYTKTPSHLRMSASQHEETKTKLERQIKEPYFEGLRAQWHSKLEKAGLKAEDWADITPEEMEQVANTLGDGIEEESDEDMVVVGPTASGPFPQAFSTPFFQPLAPSISTSTRSSNVSSASSYALVDPKQFYSEDEDDYFWKPVMATSHDLTSDDDDSPGLPVPIHNQSHHFNGWSSDSVPSSLQNSVDSFAEIPFSRPPLSNFPQNIPIVRQPTNKSATSLLSEKEKVKEKLSAEKTKIRQSYIGPHLDDSNEPLSEADDFELFKMQTRMQKIVEFHQAAALAEIRLAIEIYKERTAPNGETHEVSARVVEHQKRMSELQSAKEEERKATVKAERAKRRSELRTRPGRSNTLIAPKPSIPTNPSWLTDLENNMPNQLEPKFDLSQILSEDPNEQQNSVDKLLQQMSSHPQQLSLSLEHVLHVVTKHSEWVQQPCKSLSAHQEASIRRQQAKARPSPFGEDDPVTKKPLRQLGLLNHLQEDPELAAAFAQYSAIGGGSNGGSKQPSPPVPSWATKPTIQAPATQQNTWGLKESPGTPVASAWSRKKPAVSANTQATPTNLSFPHHFGMSDQNDIMVPSTPAISSSIFSKKSVIQPASPEPEEEEPIWREPPKKVSPPLPPTTASSNKPTVPAQKANIPAKPEPKVEKAALAPVSKKQNKKQRLANKKNGAATVTNTVEEAEPASAAVEEDPAESVLLQNPVSEPSAQNAEPMSFMAKMLPGMARIRKTPRLLLLSLGGMKLYRRLDLLRKSPPISRRPQLLKTPYVGFFVVQVGERSIESKFDDRGPQWGSGSNNMASSRVWNMFGSDSSAEKAAVQQQPASLFGGHSMHVPGGFGGIEDTDDAQQPAVSTPQRLRRASEAGNNSSASWTPVAKATPAVAQPQANPSPANAKKGKGKKAGRLWDDEEIPNSSLSGSPSAAASSPPDIFGGDEARIAAAIKELQEGTSKAEKLFGGAAWSGGGTQSAWGSSMTEPEPRDLPLFSSMGQRPATQSTTQQTPVWGQLNGKDKGKGKMTDLEDLPKLSNPTIHSLKRSKLTAGGPNLFMLVEISNQKREADREDLVSFEANNRIYAHTPNLDVAVTLIQIGGKSSKFDGVPAGKAWHSSQHEDRKSKHWKLY